MIINDRPETNFNVWCQFEKDFLTYSLFQFLAELDWYQIFTMQYQLQVYWVCLQSWRSFSNITWIKNQVVLYLCGLGQGKDANFDTNPSFRGPLQLQDKERWMFCCFCGMVGVMKEPACHFLVGRGCKEGVPV